MKNILLYDPHTTGHHLNYLRLYATVFQELGYKVTVLTDDVCRVKEYFRSDENLRQDIVDVRRAHEWRNKFLEDVASRRVGFVRDVADTYFAFRRLLRASKDIRRCRPNNTTFVFFMWFDDYTSKYLYPWLVDRFVDFRFACLWFHPKHMTYANDKIQRYCKLKHKVPLFFSKNVKHVGLFDSSAVEELQEQCVRDIFSKLPDVAEIYEPDLEAPLIRDILVRAKGRKIVSLVGSLDRRKNLPCFFRTAINSDENVFFLCVGPLHKDTFAEGEVAFLYETAEKYQNKIFFYDSYVDSDRVFDTIIYISSAIVAVYSNFLSSSNLIAKSAHYEKHVIVSGEFLMGSLAREYGIGMCVKPDDVDELSAAVRYIISNEGELAGDFSRFVREHSRVQLKKCLSRFFC